MTAMVTTPRKSADVGGIFPGFPGSPAMRIVLAAVFVGVIGADSLWLDGLIFRSRAWHVLLWVLSVAGLALGAFAYTRRR